MNPLTTAVLFGIIGLLALFNAVRILRTGVDKGQYGGGTSVKEAPVLFWLNVGTLVILGVVFLIIAAINFF
jgi:hypothetical protein